MIYNFRYMGYVSNFAFKELNDRQLVSINRRYGNMNPEQLNQAQGKLVGNNVTRILGKILKNPSKGANLANHIDEPVLVTRQIGQIMTPPEYQNVKNITPALKPEVIINPKRISKLMSNNAPLLIGGGLALGAGALGLGIGAKYLWDRNQQSN